MNHVDPYESLLDFDWQMTNDNERITNEQMVIVRIVEVWSDFRVIAIRFDKEKIPKQNLRDQEENNVQMNILSKWIDVCKYFVDSNKYRFTFDTNLNWMTQPTNGYRDQSKYDRIIVNSQRIQFN